MLFNSYKFLLFFPLVTGIYFILPHRFRWIHLLVASCIFYCAFIPAYIFILFFTILIDYYAGIMIEKEEGSKRKLYLIVSIIANVGVLAVFKYYNFFTESVNQLLGYLHITTNNLPLLDIILPIGLSFHTFQAMSYTIEVYRGTQKAEKHLGIYSLYVLFYPQLVAGPIERPQNIMHQFKEHHVFNYNNVVTGLRLMLWGMFKKVVIADRLAVFVNEVFPHVENFSGLPLIVATLFFTIQIYCDFSGYSDIALGSARIMGFTLMKNFNLPYFSRSISEFWSRWHISLSTWFRDYLYIPLGGNRVNKSRWFFNLFIVFMVSGLWHGANWTFIAWGALHGLYLIVAILIEKPKENTLFFLGLKKRKWIISAVALSTTFLLTSFAWIFFVSPNMKDASYVISHLFSPSFALKDGQMYTGWQTVKNFYQPYDIIILLVALIMLESVQVMQYKGLLPSFVAKLPSWSRWGIYYLMMLLIIVSFNAGQKQFIYFQF